MTLFGSIKELYHSITTPDHYASYKGDRPAGHDAVPLRTDSSTDLYVHGNRSAQLNSGPRPAADIPMAPIGPSVKVAWKRILKYLEENYPELHDQVLDGATRRDISEIEHDLDIAFPEDVKESMCLHDGQERGGRPIGLIFGIELLDLESVMEEWSIWRRVAIRVNERDRVRSTGPSSSTAPSPASSGLRRQRSIPPEAVQCVYSHPAWIPLAKDGGGNNIAVDLAPGPQGLSGQIILFGRDFDTKYVIAPSWSHFLDMFANDVEKGNPYVDDDIDDPIFAIRENGRMVHYLDLLRRRASPPRARSQTSSPTPSVSQSPASVMKLQPRGKRAEDLGELQEEPLDDVVQTPSQPAEPKKAVPSLVEESLDSVSLVDDSTKPPTITVETLEEESNTKNATATTETSTTKAEATPNLVEKSIEKEAEPAKSEAETQTPEPSEASEASSPSKSKSKKKKNKKKT